MKKIFVVVLVFIISVSITLGVYKLSNKYNMSVIYSQVEWDIYQKGIEGARSFDIDDSGNLYVAFSNMIRVISNDDNEEILLTQNDFNIYDIAYYKENY